MRFPLIGSAVLFSLFLLFKVLPKVRPADLVSLTRRSAFPRALIPLSAAALAAPLNEFQQVLVHTLWTAQPLVLCALCPC